MNKIINIDDKKRLPWRFHGSFLSLLGNI